MAFEIYRAAVNYLVDELWKGSPPQRPPGALQARIREVLAELGNPQDAFPVIHVGGTTGKGSTATMAAAILQAAGYRTGLYVSPFLQCFIERTSIDGVLISPDRFADSVESLKPLVERMHDQVVEGKGWGRPTILEVLFAVALHHFAREEVDAAVIEVGLGGRTDTTNVFDPSAVSVITNVQLDHTEVLGDSEEAIAREKAAIIKRGSLAASGAQGGALAVIKEHCREKAVPLWTAEGELSVVVAPNCSLDIFTPKRSRRVNRPGLHGAHQYGNALIAIAAVDALRTQMPRFAVDDDAVNRGIFSARLPGRLETVQLDPRVVLDGAHNPAAAAVLRAAITEGAVGPYDRLILVLGILADKDRALILRALAPLADHLILTTPPYTERAGDPADILEQARLAARTKADVELIRDPERALDGALSIAAQGDLVLVTGSIYLIGRLRGRWFSEEAMLRDRRVAYMDDSPSP